MPSLINEDQQTNSVSIVNNLDNLRPTPSTIPTMYIEDEEVVEQPPEPQEEDSDGISWVTTVAPKEPVAPSIIPIPREEEVEVEDTESSVEEQVESVMEDTSSPEELEESSPEEQPIEVVEETAKEESEEAELPRKEVASVSIMTDEDFEEPKEVQEEVYEQPTAIPTRISISPDGTISNNTNVSSMLNIDKDVLNSIHLPEDVRQNILAASEKTHTPKPTVPTMEESISVPTLDEELTLALGDFDERVIDSPVEEEIEDIFAEEDISDIGIEYGEPEEVIVPLMSNDEYIKWVSDAYSIFGDEYNGTQKQYEMGNAIGNRKTLENRLSKLEGSYYTQEQQRAAEALFDASGENPIISTQVKIDNSLYGDKTYTSDFLNKLSNNSVISGKHNTGRFISSVAGKIKRIHLYNSGFWVDVQSPDPADIVEFQLSVQSKADEYGRLLGESIYSPKDYYGKKAVFELFKRCVIGSNLIGWDKDPTLDDNISALDFHTCVYAVLSVMFDKGATVEFVCAHDGCKHLHKALVDISKMKVTNFTRIGSSAIQYVHDKEKRTSQDLEKYKSEILNAKSKIRLSENWACVIRDPSIGFQLQSNYDFITKMIGTIQVSQVADADYYAKASVYKILTPWIEHVIYTKDSKSYILKDFADSIGKLQLDPNINLTDSVEEFIATTGANHFGYPYGTCPSCKRTPPNLINGIIPCDLLKSFFSHTRQYMITMVEQLTKQ